MSILLKSKPALLLLVVTISISALGPFWVKASEEITSESDLANRLISDLAGNGRREPVLQNNQLLVNIGSVKGSSVKVPFFPRGYTYPIAELGGCDSKTACREYCDLLSNIEMCAMLSYRQGYMNSTQLNRSLRLAVQLRNNEFTNCNDFSGCMSFCDNVQNDSDCLQLAEGLGSSPKVLGDVDDGMMSSSVSIFSSCLADLSCSAKLSSQNQPQRVVQNLIESGLAPSQCYEGQQCITFCASSNSQECSVLLAAMGKAIVGEKFSLTPRVLTSQDNTFVPALSDTPEPEPPQPDSLPDDLFDCVASPTNNFNSNLTGLVTNVELDSFQNNFNQCEGQFAEDALASRGNQIAQQETADKINDLVECYLRQQNSFGIPNCLAQ